MLPTTREQYRAYNRHRCAMCDRPIDGNAGDWSGRRVSIDGTLWWVNIHHRCAEGLGPEPQPPEPDEDDLYDAWREDQERKELYDQCFPYEEMIR